MFVIADCDHKSNASIWGSHYWFETWQLVSNDIFSPKLYSW